MFKSAGKHLSPSLVISCLALFIALGSVGYSATGGSFILGKGNSANKTTQLSSGNAGGPTLKVTNTGGRSAAAFITKSGKAPFTVNRTQKVANLNADLVDGLDSTAFLQSVSVAGGDLGGPFANLQLIVNSVGQAEIGVDGVAASEIANDSIDSGEIVDFGLSNQDIGVLFAEVSAAGGLDNESGGVTVTKLGGLGNYEVDFGRNIAVCAAVATIGPAGAGSATGEINVADRSANVEAVFIDTNDSAGAAADKPFRLIVVC